MKSTLAGISPLVDEAPNIERMPSQGEICSYANQKPYCLNGPDQLLTQQFGRQYTFAAGKPASWLSHISLRDRRIFKAGGTMQDMNSLIEKYVNEPVWAVVGASNSRAKYGNRIYLKLRKAGYTVYPVNRRERLIEGDTAYGSLADLPEPPTVINMVVPPVEAPAIVEQAKAAGAQAIWFQPGAESAAAARWAQTHGLDVIEACILVQLALMPRPEGTEPNRPSSRSRPTPSPDPTTSTR